MIVIEIDKHPGVFELIRNVMDFFMGEYGPKYREGIPLPNHVKITVSSTYELPGKEGCHHSTLMEHPHCPLKGAR